MRRRLLTVILAIAGTASLFAGTSSASPPTHGSGVGTVLARSIDSSRDADGNVIGRGDAAAQWRRCLENIRALVEAAGGSMADVVHLGIYVRDMQHHLAHNEIRESRLPMKRIGIRLGPQAGQVELVDNKIEGLAVAVSDLRKS